MDACHYITASFHFGLTDDYKKSKAPYLWTAFRINNCLEFYELVFLGSIAIPGLDVIAKVNQEHDFLRPRPGTLINLVAKMKLYERLCVFMRNNIKIHTYANASHNTEEEIKRLTS